MKRKTPLVAGNWKMNPVTLSEAKKIFLDIKKMTKKATSTIMIAPPFPFLYELGKARAGSGVMLGAQDMFFEQAGAYTGEVSPKMLVDAGVTYVILGHSERRALGEADAVVRKKLDTALKAKVTPIVCVGERERDSHGNFFSFVETQLVATFKDMPAATAKRVIIAYEPIWAIGTGNTAAVEDVEEMQLFIKKILTKQFDRKVAENISLLYGGSVNTENCSVLFTDSGIDGFLVGGASLKPADFATIVKATE